MALDVNAKFLLGNFLLKTLLFFCCTFGRLIDLTSQFLLTLNCFLSEMNSVPNMKTIVIARKLQSHYSLVFKISDWHLYIEVSFVGTFCTHKKFSMLHPMGTPSIKYPA